MDAGNACGYRTQRHTPGITGIVMRDWRRPVRAEREYYQGERGVTEVLAHTGAAGENADGMLVGAHMQTTGGIQNALLEGKRIGCGCVQLFTTSPQQWKARPLSADQVEVFASARRDTS